MRFRRVPGVAMLGLVLPAVFTMPARAELPTVTITGHGEYVSRIIGPMADSAAPHGVVASVSIADPQLVNDATRVEARLCRQFGIVYRAEGAWPVNATVRITHPRLVRPDGASGRVDSWTTVLNGSGFAGFTFSEPWEAVPGEWTFAIVVDNRVLAEQSFDIVDTPVDGAAPVTACDRPIS